MEDLYEAARRRLDAERQQMKEEIRRDLRRAGDKAIAKIRPVLEALERRK